MEIIDISLPISEGMAVWPGAPKTEFQWRRSMSRGDASNNSNFFMNSHAGTHVDAPLHFEATGKSVESLVLADLVGEAFVLDFSEEEGVTVAGLESRWPRNRTPERILLKTKNSLRAEGNRALFFEDFCALGENETRWLLGKKIRLVGIDAPSIQFYKTSPVVHRLLLGAGVIVVEGLHLSQVPAGRYELICLPLKLKGLEGAPCRAVLKHVEE